MIQGELLLQAETCDHMLSEGDALTFDSSIGHTYVNQTDTLVKFMVINFYPATL